MDFNDHSKGISYNEVKGFIVFYTSRQLVIGGTQAEFRHGVMGFPCLKVRRARGEMQNPER